MMRRLVIVAMLGSALLLGVGIGFCEEAMDERLAEINSLLERLEPAGRQNLNVPREHGKFLRMLVEMSGAKRAVEVGTSNGYSSMWIGLGLENTKGNLVTLEIDPEKVTQARANLEEAGMDKRITVVEGDALETLPNVEGPMDFLFLDALKGDYIKYLELAKPKLSKGAIIAAHNAISAKDALGEYFAALDADPTMQTVIVSIEPGDGFAVTYVMANPKAEE